MKPQTNIKIISETLNDNAIQSSEFLSKINTQLEEFREIDKNLKDTKSNVVIALNKANEAKGKKAGIVFGNKEVIEALQEVAINQAEATKELYNNQVKFHDSITRLANCSKGLFALSMTNIANVRIVIGKIKELLNGECLSDEGKAEFIRLLRDLESYADVTDRINRIKDKTQNLGQEIYEAKRKIEEVSDLLVKRDSQYSNYYQSLENVQKDCNDFKRFRLISIIGLIMAVISFVLSSVFILKFI